jgi:hypothetical protein
MVSGVLLFLLRYQRCIATAFGRMGGAFYGVGGKCGHRRAAHVIMARRHARMDVLPHATEAPIEVSEVTRLSRSFLTFKHMSQSIQQQNRSQKTF